MISNDAVAIGLLRTHLNKNKEEIPMSKCLKILIGLVAAIAAVVAAIYAFKLDKKLAALLKGKKCACEGEDECCCEPEDCCCEEAPAEEAAAEEAVEEAPAEEAAEEVKTEEAE